MSNPSVASEDGSSVSAPARVHLVAAVGAVLDDDPLGAAIALQDAVDASSWEVVEGRVDVALRALRLDAELEPWRGPLDDVDHVRVGSSRWSSLWRGVHVVAALARRAGYPPEVVA